MLKIETARKLSGKYIKDEVKTVRQAESVIRAHARMGFGNTSFYAWEMRLAMTIAHELDKAGFKRVFMERVNDVDSRYLGKIRMDVEW